MGLPCTPANQRSILRARGFNVLVFPLLALSLVSLVAGDVDRAFCAKYITTQSSSPWTPPDMRDNFMVVVERKLLYNYNKSYEMSNTEMYFSRQRDSARLVLDNVDDIFDVYALGKRNTLFKLTRGLLYPDCIGVPLRGSPMGLFLVAAKNNTESILGTPSEALQFAKGLIYYNFTQSGVTLKDRGISVNVVKTCHYHAETDGTSVGTFYFNDPSKTKMPGDPARSVIVRAEVNGVNHHWDPNNANPYNYSLTYDYTHFAYGRPIKQSIFQIDSNLYCKFPNNSNPLPLPTVTAPFRYRLDILTRTNYGGKNESQELVRFIITYSELMKTFIQETVGPSTGYDNLIQTERDIMINDFNTGMQFTVDRIRGGCQTSQIDKFNIDVDSLKKYVAMKTVKQLLNLDGDYQYFGQKLVRGIACDVWRAAFGDEDVKGHLQNSIYTWYFASTGWKNRFRKDLLDAPLPVQLDIEVPVRDDVLTGVKVEGSGIFITYSLYEFTHAVEFQPIPEISACFSSDKINNFQFFLDGDFLSTVVPDKTAFRLGLVRALMSYGQFTSPNRMSRIDFMPWERRKILVLVTLLDYSGLVGDVKAPESEPSNDKVIVNIRNTMNNGDFTVSIIRMVDGTESRVLVNAPRDSLKAFDPIEEKPYIPGRPGGGDNGGDSSSSSGYGSGDMAGLAIGMIVTTLVVTLAAVYLFMRFRGISDGQSVAMSKLSPDP